MIRRTCVAIFVLSLTSVVTAFSVVAQPVTSSVSQQNETRIRAWIDAELAKGPYNKWVYTHADVYERALRQQAERALGIAPDIKNSDPEPFSASAEPSDTGRTTDVSSKKFTWQDETSIAIDRASTNVIAIGANDQNMGTAGMPVYYTKNFGKNWTLVHIPIGTTSSIQNAPLGDPMLASGPDSVLYYAYLVQQYSTAASGFNIFIATSLDGQHWTNGAPPISIDTFPGLQDKEQICVDMNRSSPHYGRLYLVWVHYNVDTSTGFYDGTGRTLITHSDDRAKSWSNPVAIEEIIAEFCQVRCGKKGEVLVTYSAPANGSGNSTSGEHNFHISTDGGDTWTTKPIASYSFFPINADGRSAVKGTGGPRTYPYIAFDVDLRTNLLHLVYGDNYSDVATQYYVTSTDLGTTWSNRVAIGYNDSTPGAQILLDRFDPWVSVNQKTGDAFLTYYSSERDSTNMLISPFRLRLNGNKQEGSKWLDTADFDPTPVTTQLSAHGAGFIGDYIGSDVWDSIYAAAWCQGVNTDGEVYAYIGMPHLPASVGGYPPTLVYSDRLRLSSVYPNPSPGRQVFASCYSPVSSEAELTLFDINGKMISSLWKGTLDAVSAVRIAVELPKLSAGTYFVRLTSASSSDECKLVIRNDN
ncbi:MAG TPA: T9SS type A sorting domain-containing protein [Candidatus Kapabacteria bacterium]|nr:T9SS type A sorting domain-containing protein [Candidatus Kapabacteria bacterium]